MTYKDLLQQLQNLPEDRLNDNVTVLDPYGDEFIAVIDTAEAKDEENDVLDDGHFYLVLKA